VVNYLAKDNVKIDAKQVNCWHDSGRLKFNMCFKKPRQQQIC
jgi:hypothetical protein